MSRKYLVRIDKDVGSDWGASLPDLPGCVATGRTLDAARRRIERAITLHIRGMQEVGIRVPPAKHRVVTPRRSSHHVNFYFLVTAAGGVPFVQRPSPGNYQIDLIELYTRFEQALDGYTTDLESQPPLQSNFLKMLTNYGAV
jgi:predicted RNase H-like HicB family nuclease